MRIINTSDNIKIKMQKLKLQFKIKKTCFLMTVFVFCFCLLALSACVKDDDPQQIQNYIRQSEQDYQRAVAGYEKLINQGKNLSQLYFQLGSLYFNHGEFQLAAEQFKKSDDKKAKEYLAISYYRLGNLTDAAEILARETALSDQALYYYGLTSEKLNLFDQALAVYRKIREKKITELANQRISIIEKEVNLLKIKDISPQTYQIISKSPSEKEYPQAGSLILLSDEKIIVTTDNRQVSEVHYIVKILNERGKEDFAETHIDYDSTYEKIELEYARTIKPDGTVVDVGSRHIRDVSKYLNFPLYSNARVYIISFPEISEGATIEYKLKIYRNQLVNKKDFVLSYPVQTSQPIIAADFVLSVPQTKTLHLKKLNEKYNNFAANLVPTTNQEAGFVNYHWKFQNIPQIIPEANMSAVVEVNPTIFISSFNSWEEIYRWWWGLAKDKIQADSGIKNQVKELIKDKNSAEEKIRAIYNFCAQKIRYVAVEYGQAGYEPHKAEDTFKNKYGDCKDKAILLVTMLKEAGFGAYPVLISTREYYNLNKDFPSMLFNHAIAAIPLGEKLVFMDSTAETCSFNDLPREDQDRKVLVFKENSFSIESTPLYPAEHNLVKQNISLKINADETILAQKKISTEGVYDQSQRYWLLYTTPELIGESLKERIQEFSIGSKLKGYDIENLNNLNTPVILSYTFSGPEYLILAGNLRIMPQLANLDATVVAKEKRKFPIDLIMLDTKEIIFEISLPEDFVVKYIPNSVNEENPWFKFSAEYKQEANRLYFKQKTQTKEKVITEDDYPVFKSSLEDLAKKVKQRVILEKIK